MLSVIFAYFKFFPYRSQGDLNKLFSTMDEWFPPFSCKLDVFRS